MNDSPKLPTRRSRRPLLIALILFLTIGLAAGGTLWWWQNRKIEPVLLTQTEKVELEERMYEKGKKSFVLTEREINGLIHANTNLGEDVKVELASGAIHLRVKTKLDPDVPVLGGKTVKAKARLIASNEEGLVIDDITVYGVSLPNAWVGNLKGVSLFSALEDQLPAGVKSIEVRNGEMQVELEE